MEDSVAAQMHALDAVSRRSSTSSASSRPPRGSARGSSRSVRPRSRSRSSSGSAETAISGQTQAKGHGAEREAFEAFRMLPLCIQKVEKEREMGLWKEGASTAQATGAGKKTSPRRWFSPADDEPARAPDAAAEELGVLAYNEFTQLEIGSRLLRRVDIRNPIIIDPLATRIPQQPPKMLMLREFASLYHEANAEELSKSTWAQGGTVGVKLRKMFEREKARKENRRGGEVPQATDPIPYAPTPETTALLLAAIPKPPFKFLNIVKAAAPEMFSPSLSLHPYDWVPKAAGELSSYKTLPAIFWSPSKEEAVSIVFYMFPTTKNISYPVSVGVVEDKAVPNIPVKPVKFMSQSLLKAYWSGYIDFSRPMIIPNSAIYNGPSLASANEMEFWSLWKGLFKKPTYGGHQYGMTDETEAFENPVRLCRFFEGSRFIPGKYTAQMALEKRPLRQKRTLNDLKDSDSDDMTVRGYDSESEADSDNDDSKTITGINGRNDDDFSDNEIEFNNNSQEKPIVKGWLDTFFDRPSTITLDENVKITVPKRDISEILVTSQHIRKPLKEVKIQEDGIWILPGRKYNNPEEFSNVTLGPDNKAQEEEELSAFEKRTLRLLSMVIGPSGTSHLVSSAHIPYRYDYPGVKDTKSFLQYYRRQCVQEAQIAEIREKGRTEIGDGPYVWDGEVHKRLMEKEISLNEVMKAFKQVYGLPPFTDKTATRMYEMVIQSKRAGRLTIPAPWIPEPVLKVLGKVHSVRLKADGYSVRNIGTGPVSENERATSEEWMMKFGIPKAPRKKKSTKKQKDGPPPLPPRPPQLKERIRRDYVRDVFKEQMARLNGSTVEGDSGAATQDGNSARSKGVLLDLGRDELTREYTPVRIVSDDELQEILSGSEEKIGLEDPKRLGSAQAQKHVENGVDSRGDSEDSGSEQSSSDDEDEKAPMPDANNPIRSLLFCQANTEEDDVDTKSNSQDSSSEEELSSSEDEGEMAPIPDDNDPIRSFLFCKDNTDEDDVGTNSSSKEDEQSSSDEDETAPIPDDNDPIRSFLFCPASNEDGDADSEGDSSDSGSEEEQSSSDDEYEKTPIADDNDPIRSLLFCKANTDEDDDSNTGSSKTTEFAVQEAPQPPPVIEASIPPSVEEVSPVLSVREVSPLSATHEVPSSPTIQGISSLFSVHEAPGQSSVQKASSLSSIPEVLPLPVREFSPPPPADKPVPFQRNSASVSNQMPSLVPFEFGSSRVITRAELLAMKKARSLYQKNSDQSLNPDNATEGHLPGQPDKLQTQFQEYAQEPGKVRIPDIFMKADLRAKSRNVNPLAVPLGQPFPPLPKPQVAPGTVDADSKLSNRLAQAIQKSSGAELSKEMDWSGLRRRLESRRRNDSP
ncbi:hypothetical protein TWF730_001498 [Orbilia blumenaviensis]|uniref:Uncharacterized protein n=1 Tax=Orbilia blumenaviensis TaxID=1796055 RepID=A0AAV9UIK2_9PEZI